MPLAQQAQQRRTTVGKSEMQTLIQISHTLGRPAEIEPLGVSQAYPLEHGFQVIGSMLIKNW